VEAASEADVDVDGGVIAAIRVLGWSTRVSTPLAVAAAVVSTVITALVASSKRLKLLPGKVLLLLPLAMAAGLIYAFFTRDTSAGITRSGDLTAETRQAVYDFHVDAGSRFVVTTTLLLEEHRRTGSVSLRKFYVRRALRLLPAASVLLVVGVALSLSVGQRSGASEGDRAVRDGCVYRQLGPDLRAGFAR
jgi:peptidoglycan/LPS O-acetylase OafA/YrhL